MVLVTKTAPAPTPVIPAAAPAVKQAAPAIKAPAPVTPTTSGLTPVPPGMVFPGVPEAPRGATSSPTESDEEWLRRVSRPATAAASGPDDDGEWLRANSRPAGVAANYDPVPGGWMNSNPETRAYNERVARDGIGTPITPDMPGLLPWETATTRGTLPARESIRVSARELAAAREASPGLRAAADAARADAADLAARIEQARADPTALAAERTRIQRAGFGTPSDDERFITDYLEPELVAAERAALAAEQAVEDNETAIWVARRDRVTGGTRQTMRSAIFNAGVGAFIRTGTETLRGVGIAADALQYLVTGDTNDNALVRTMAEANDVINAILPVGRSGFVVDLASGTGSFAGFLTAGFAAKAVSGGSRLLQNIAVGSLGGFQQGAAQADMAVEGTIAQEIGRLKFDNPGGVNNEAIALLEDALAIVRYQSFAAGFGVGLTELVPIDRMIARADVASGGAISRRLRAAASGSVEEGIQEFFQNASADQIQQVLADPDHPIDWDSALGAAVVGMVIGAGAGGVLVNVNGREVSVEDLARERNIPPGAAPGAAPAEAPPEGVPEGAEPADTLYPSPEPAAAAPAGTPPPTGVGPSPVGPAGTPAAAPAGGGGGPAAPAPVVAPAAVSPVASPAPAPGAAAPVDVGAGPVPAPPVASVGTDGAPLVGAGVAGGVVAPVAAPSPQGIPFVITQHQRAQLGALGYDPETIRQMTPAMAQEAIVNGRPSPVAMPPSQQIDADWVAANSRPVNWTPPAGVPTPEAPNVAVPNNGPSAPAAGPAPARGVPVEGAALGGGADIAPQPAPGGGGAALPGGADAGLRPQAGSVGLPKRGRSLDLLQFIASLGGIRPTDNLIAKDAHRKFLPGYGKFVRLSGRDADKVRELVAESGYFGTGDRSRAIAETTPDDLDALIGRALAGERITPDDADDMAFEAEANLSAEHEKYLDRLEGELRAWMQDYDFDDDAAWLRAMVKVADESGLMYGFSAEDFESVYTRAAVLLADQKRRKAVADEIPFDLHPEDVRAAAAGAGPRNDAPGGGESVSGGRPGVGEAPAAGGGGEGQAAQGLGAAAENPDADRVVATFKTARGSTYQVFADGTTKRDKAARDDVGHEGDSGAKPRTQRTVYVEGNGAGLLSAAGLQNIGAKGARVAIRGNRAVLLMWNDARNNWGTSSDPNGTPIFDEPAVGRSPLELWKPADDVPGYDAYRGMHAGNLIVELTPTAPPAPAVDQTDAGAQFVLPGAEQISDAEHAQNLADKPLRPTVDQKPADDGLFGDSAAQMDLVDMAKAPAPKVEPPAAEPAAEGRRLTAEGPWDFENTYPDIDRAQYERLLNERPDPFDAAGEPSPEQITEMIDAILWDLQGRHTAILRTQEAITKAKPADKKAMEAKVAGLFEGIKGLGDEMRGIWPETAVDAILGAGRKRATAEWKGAAPKPAEEKKPAVEQAAPEPVAETAAPPPAAESSAEVDPADLKNEGRLQVATNLFNQFKASLAAHPETVTKQHDGARGITAGAKGGSIFIKKNDIGQTVVIGGIGGAAGAKWNYGVDYRVGDLVRFMRHYVEAFPASAKPPRPAPQPAPNASWVIKNKATGEVVMETFDQAKVDALNTEKYVAVPIKEYLASLNRPTGAVEMTADVEGVTFNETPPPAAGVAYYIATGEKGAMYTLRRHVGASVVDGKDVPARDTFMGNLSRDKQEAVRKAKQHVKAKGITSVYWGAPEVLNDIEVGAGGSGSSGSAVEMPTEMVDPITAAGLAVKALTAKSGRTYWAVSGDMQKHEAILDQLGFAPLRKINNVWQRSYFTSDPTAALAEALATGKAPLKEPPAPLPMKNEGPAIDPDVAKAILAKAKIVVTADKGGFVVTGKTFDIKSEIKEAGGRWDGAAKGWRFSNDPTQKLAALAGANAGANAGADGEGDAGTGIDPAEDARLRAAREREDARADERVGDASRLVSDESKELIRRGLKFGIPTKVVNEQIEDVGMIVNARERKKPMFLLANEAGTGKTFVMGAAIRELRNRGQKRFIYITQSQDLIAQIERDLVPYGLEGVEFATYSKMPQDAKGAAIFFDETHNIKNLAGSQRGKNGADLIAQADFTVFASATPFQNPVEAKYLEATGIYGKHGDAHSEWAKMYGAAVRRRKFYNPTTRREQVEEIVYWPGRGKKKDGAAARQWFFKQGVMTQRTMQIDPGMVDVAFTRAPVAEQYVKLYKQIEDAYETVLRRWTDESGNSRDYKITSEVARHRETTIKRVLEAAKGPAAIARAKEIIGEGKNVVLFVETKAERTIGKFRKSEHFKEDTLYTFPEMQNLMEAWAREAESARRMNERPPPQPFASFIYEIARGMHDHGILHELPSVADDFMEAMGGKEKVAVYTGAVAQAAARKNKEDFLSGRKKVLVATMAKGGTGLSLHDTVGNRETVQLNINLPWAAWQVDQVSARVARYGLKSKAKIEWMFASNIDWETTKLAPRVGARMEAMGAIVKGIEVKAAEKLLGDFDFEGDVDVKQDSANTIDVTAADGYAAEDDIYANAARLERGRVKASDTTGGFFETPYPLAALMTRVAGIRPGDKVLEPSAGTGNLLEFIPTDAKVTAIEVRRENHDKLGERLRRRGVTNRRTFLTDFIEWSEQPGMTPDAKDFDVVLMNPPFEREAGVGALDVAHVERAYGLLKPGGRLVAIMGEGSFFRQTKQEAAFREWLDDVGATVIKLPENAFKKSGTGVRTRMVVIDKDRPGGRSTIDLADMESASLRGIEMTIPSRPSDGMGMMEEWDRLGLGGMGETDRKDTRTGGLFGKKPAPAKPGKVQLGPLDALGHFDLGAFDAGGRPLGEAAQRYVVENGIEHGVEFLVAFDQNGKTVINGHGNDDSTGDTLAFNVALMDPANKIVSHHNHPSGRPFSRADITFLGFEGHSELWVHGHNGSVYKMSLTADARARLAPAFAIVPPAGPGLRRRSGAFGVVAAVNDAASGPIVDVIRAKVLSGALTAAQAEVTNHFVLLALHKASVIDYAHNIALDPSIAAAFAKNEIDDLIVRAATAAQNRMFGHAAAPPLRKYPLGGDDRGTKPGDRHAGGMGASFAPPPRGAPRLGSADFRRARTNPGRPSQGGGQGLNQPVWHGSGKKGIKKFLMSFIGTGEGNASFGWGFYAAKAEGTGTHYRTTVGGRPYYEILGQPMWELAGPAYRSGDWAAQDKLLMERLGIGPAVVAVGNSMPSVDGRHPAGAYFEQLAHYSVREVLRNVGPESGGFEAYAAQQEARAKEMERGGENPHNIYDRYMRAAIARALIPIAKRVKPGALYRLEIPEDDVMLNWDKPFHEQPEAVRSALMALAPQFGWPAGKLTGSRSIKGGEIYEDAVGEVLAQSKALPSRNADERKAQRAAAKKDVSLALLAHGVQGIKFLDQFSRQSADNPTHNYVIFDDAAIEVVEELEDRVQGFGEDDGDQTQTAAFKKWFGASKVVDKYGKPLRVYHGSPDARGLEVFKTLKERFGSADPERAFFFTNDMPTAATYADDRRAFDYQNAEPATLALYLRIENPLVVDNGGARYSGPQPQADLIAQAKAAGHDGIIIRRTVDTYNVTGKRLSDIYIAFAPEQIKSATGNSGAFDPSNPSILASQRTAPAVRPERRAEMGDIANNVQAIVTRLLGRKVRVELVDTIEDASAPTAAWDRQQREAAAATGGGQLAGTAGGLYSHDKAAPARSFIRLALNDPLYDPLDAAHHESWHHIETALSTEEERDVLRRDLVSPTSGIKRLAEEHLRVRGFTNEADGISAMPAYEITAIAFEGYARKRMANQPIGPLHIGIRRFFDSIMEMLERIKVMLGRRGIKTWEDVFEAAYRGGMAKRTPVSAFDEVEAQSQAIADLGRMSDEARDVFGMQEGGNLFDPGASQNRQATLQKRLSLRQPIDRTLRIPFDVFGGMNRKGEWKPGLFVTDKVGKLLTSSRFSDTGRFRFLNPLLHRVRAGLIDRYGLDPDYVERDRIRGLDERATMMEAQDVLETLRKAGVGSTEAKVLQAVLNGEPVTDAQMEALAAPIRMAIDAMGQEAVDLGLLSAESFERNRGAYLHRVYMKHEAEQNGLIRFVDKIRTGNRRKIIGAQFKGRGLWQEVAASALTDGKLGQPPVKGMTFRMLDLIDTDGQGNLPDVMKGKKDRVVGRVYVPANQPVLARYAEYQDRGVWEVRGFRNGSPILWRDYTKAERAKMGEITDARYTITKTFMVMAHDLATGRFYRDIAMNKSWAQVEEPLPGTWKDASEYRRFWEDAAIGWVRVPETKISKSNTLRYGALAGKFVRADIWRDLNELELLQRPSVWNTLLTEWKKNKTARSPVTHMNNVMSNLIFMDINDVGVTDLIGGIKSMVAGDAAYDEAMAAGAFGADMVAQELRNDILRPLLKEIEQQTQGSVGTVSSKLGMLGKLAEALWSGAKGIDRFALRLYQLEDEVFRMALYNRRRRQGYPPREAALDARDTFLNYDIRAPWVNAARRTVLPFISYTYRAIPGIAKAIATHPWKLGKYIAISYAMNAAAYALLGLDDEDEDRERRSLRDNEQGYTWVGAPRMLRMPWSDENGNPVFLDIRRWIPVGDVFDLEQSNGAVSLPPWLQLGGPLAIAAEVMFNKSLFTGDPLVNTLTDDFWERGQTVADYLWKQVMPGGPWVPGSWYWEKIVDSVTGARDWSGRPYDLASAIASSFGIKLKPQDVENGFALHAFAYEEVERALRAEANRLGRDLARNQITQAEFDRQMAGVISDMERLNQRRLETFAP